MAVGTASMRTIRICDKIQRDAGRRQRCPLVATLVLARSTARRVPPGQTAYDQRARRTEAFPISGLRIAKPHEARKQPPLLPDDRGDKIAWLDQHWSRLGRDRAGGSSPAL